MAVTPLDLLLNRAFDARAALHDASHTAAFRLFNGFLEGWPTLTVDLYGHTAVVNDHAEPGANSEPDLAAVEAVVREKLPFVDGLLVKPRRDTPESDARGTLRFGTALCRKIVENGTRYALDLTLNRDASFYLDTRLLRAWLQANMAGQTVLNTFAYTGSLGVAARAAPAKRVLQTDLNRAFLNLAKMSFEQNGWPVARADFRPGDFFEVASTLKREGVLFDCALVDPPFFSTTAQGTVDVQGEFARLLNKVRPLIGHGGRLVAVNNALFVSGADFHRQLQEICASGYLAIEALIPVADDCAGYPSTRQGTPPADPAPFNHSTKIAVLRVTRKDGRTAA